MADSQCTEFHQFSKFPPEIRRQIWEYVVEEPHVVHIRGFQKGGGKLAKDDRATQILHNGGECTYWYESDENKLNVVPKFPPVHDVCHEARKAFLESPGLIPETAGLGVAWHPERDIVMCHSMAADPISGGGLRWSWWDVIGIDTTPRRCQARPHHDLPDCLDVRHLRFDLDEFHEAYRLKPKMRDDDLREFFSTGDDVQETIPDRFPYAKTFELVVGDEHRLKGRYSPSIGVAFEFPPHPFEFLDTWNVINFLRDCDGTSVRIIGKIIFDLACCPLPFWMEWLNSEE
ncbi:hypothetical protein PG997_001450 [Apiospora hydei]|uniref:2EXR domain-containing protein n=1 Tax=Apiospora hydei TaxID=1337664 RepID=A0ABR1XDJ7_9PEZI